MSELGVLNRFRKWCDCWAREVVGRVSAAVILPLRITLEKLTFVKNHEKTVWLIGENQGECVRDNGYAFYEYCRKIYPEMEVYFLLKPISPYYQGRASTDENLVAYGSIRHMHLFNESSVCFYTHTYRDVMYRRYFEFFGGNKKLVYLHHGTLGLKKFNRFYQSTKNRMDMFTVGSNLEKMILIDKIGVDRERIRVTGYARYDSLRRLKRSDGLQILFMPTHRNYLKSSKSIEEFFAVLNSFICNEVLVELLEKNQITLKVYMHFGLQRKYFRYLRSNSRSVQLVSIGEAIPQQLICESDLLITDYSSVCWDAFHLGIPILFYRFDIDRYLLDRSSYIDLQDESVGEIALKEDQLVELVGDYVHRGFPMTQLVSEYRSSVLPKIDASNCERIFEEVVKL